MKKDHTFQSLKALLDSKADQYNHPDFIPTDPIQIPHLFSRKEDIEIMGFLIATIAWGNRKSIITNGYRLVDLMKNDPYSFILNYQEQPITFVHRTFNEIDLNAFFVSLHRIYTSRNSLESCFQLEDNQIGMLQRIVNFRNQFTLDPFPSRTQKHISNPLKGAAAKRINMFLRWMVRADEAGVDFGIWKSIPMSELLLPLDVHTGNVARALGLLTRTQDDWKSVMEIHEQLIQFDPVDPCKYDFALFGIGAFEGSLTKTH
jgi:uncharacterized protein (TIGR02757 family)